MCVLCSVFFVAICKVDKEKRQVAERFALNVKKYRTESHLTQMDVAERASTGLRQVQAIEYGERVPNVVLAYFIAKAIGVSLDQLFEWVTHVLIYSLISKSSTRLEMLKPRPSLLLLLRYIIVILLQHTWTLLVLSSALPCLSNSLLVFLCKLIFV